MARDEIFDGLAKAVLLGDDTVAEELTRKALSEGIAPYEIIEKGLSEGMREVGRKYEEREYALPELMLAAEAFYTALKILEPELKKERRERKTLGKVVIGVVQFDVHDIGKTIVRTMLEASGFECVDLGRDVPTEDFVQTVRDEHPDILGLSALMTTTMPEQQRVIEALKEAGLRDSVKVMVGGAPVSREWAERIGADGYGEDAIDAVVEAKKLLGISD
ncbi:corrinoid protein [Candidatus Alkanophaga liquidiphilum]|nr:Methanogenic corrinoid protein MtbC1 [Candidatus Alkanophaga liquidiphilum]RLG38667.1 MAG: hypothetical protein DRN91_01955 [Candidatus Alkanophagales archaeon]